MGKVLDGITDDVREFIEKQHLFFVATAPLATDGHVNVSPWIAFASWATIVSDTLT